jgi:hypothetical protein
MTNNERAIALNEFVEEIERIKALLDAATKSNGREILRNLGKAKDATTCLLQSKIHGIKVK